MRMLKSISFHKTRLSHLRGRVFDVKQLNKMTFSDIMNPKSSVNGGRSMKNREVTNLTEIRRAVAADAEKILEYCKIIGAESDNLTFGAEGVSITPEKERDYLESILRSDKNLYLAAVDKGEIVGTAVFSSFSKARLAHRAEISISVKKSMWGNHIGTRFMERIIDFAKNVAGTEIISLEVRSDNQRAIALYKKFGFEKVGTFKGYMKINGTDVDCDIMRLSFIA